MAGRSVCVGAQVPDIRDDAFLDLPFDVSDSPSCENERRRMYWCHLPELVGSWAPAVHTACVHNEQAGLVWRSLGKTPEYVESPYLTREFWVLRRMVRRFGLTPRTTEEVAMSYKGKMRIKYMDANTSLQDDGVISRRDRRLSAFIKGEKVNPLARSPTKPRVIMARSPRFNLRLMCYLQPLEARLWKTIKTTYPGLRKTRQVAKGLNGVQRANIIREKMLALGTGCVVFEVDGSRFEAHVTREDLLLEHSVYKAAYDGDAGLSDLLQSQLEIRGKTACGIKYGRDGGRASGDSNTGMGNTIIMLAACRATMAYLADVGLPAAYDLLADGDNALIFLGPKFAGTIHTAFAQACREVCTQELVVERPVTRLEEVVFGQSHPVWDGQNWRMVREFNKVMSGAFCGYRHYNHWTHGVRVLKAVAQAEAYLSLGLPVMQDYFQEATRKLSHVKDLPETSLDAETQVAEAIKLAGSWGAVKAAQPRPITPATRASFQAAFGIDVDTQKLLESRLPKEINFPFSGRAVGWQTAAVWDVEGPEVLPGMDATFWDRA